MSVQVIGSGTIGGLDEGLNITGVVTATSFDGNINGTVGVGTDNPQGVLHVANTNTTVWPFSTSVSANPSYTPYSHELVIDNDVSNVTGSFAGIYFNAGGYATTSTVSRVSTARIAAIDTGDYKADLAFSTRGFGGSDHKEHLRIASDGQIGIGTDNPSAKLEVRDSASTGIIVRSTSTQADDTNKALRVRNNSNTNRFSVSHKGFTEIRRGEIGTYLKVGGDDAGNGRALTFTSSNTASTGALHTLNATSGNGAIALATSGTERLLVDSDGNVTVQGGELGISTNTNNTSVLTFKNTIKDHKIGGVTVSLVDDTISDDIMLPGHRHGCLLFIFAHSDTTGTYPQPGPCGMVYVDAGASTLIRPMFTQSATSANATTNVGNLMAGKDSHDTNVNNSGDGQLTIMKGSANGRIKLANRLNGDYVFYLTMM